MFYELKALYFKVKSSHSPSFDEEEKALSSIETRFCDGCLNKQIFMSGWYAHYKFFWQNQIEWVDEQKKFGFWRDKVPLSFVMTVVAVGLVVGVYLLPDIIKKFTC